MSHRLSSRCALTIGAVLVAIPLVVRPAAQSPADRCLVPAGVREAVVNEVSGERAQLHVQFLTANRDRQPEEYQNAFFETTYIQEQAKLAGLSNVQVDFFPTRETWDAEEGELWMVQPQRKKMADITQVPAALSQGSRSADVEAELLYVGSGREADYAGKDVKGKLVLGNSVGGSLNGAMTRGAAGALGLSTGMVPNATNPRVLDEIGWSSVMVPADRAGFAFALSLRQFLELRDLLERGQKVVMKAHVKTRTYPGKMNVISASIPGTDPAAGDLLMVAHAFETIATPGANDNCTGVGTTLEIARTLAHLVKTGQLPPPRRTIRFLWVPEISGTTAYMFKHPELQDTLLAALNFDMTGADMALTNSYLRIKMTPDSRPSYLNDLLANLLRFVDQSDIRTQQGQNAQFNYRLSPVATITSGSDHSVFNNGGIPAMQFNYWPDNFYHSSEDRFVNVDPTELKRVGFTAAAAMYYLATAGAPQARDLAWESTLNGEQWMAEVTRQAVTLMGTDPAKLADQYKAARTKVDGAFNRAKGGVNSVLRISDDASVKTTVGRYVATLEGARDLNAKLVDATYVDRAAVAKIKPTPVALTDKEKEASLRIPTRLFKVYSAEAQSRTSQGGPGGGGGRGGARPAPGAALPRRLPGNATGEVTNFIDGQRSILDIYNAVRAECGNLVVGREETKYGYVLSADAADVDLDLVTEALENLQKSGVIEIKTVPPPAPAKKGKKK